MKWKCWLKKKNDIGKYNKWDMTKKVTGNQYL